MKKFMNVLYILLLVVSLFVMTSCQNNNNNNNNNNEKEKEQEIKFDFDDKYFVGMQEHFYEIRAMERTLTTDFICDLNAAIGSKVFRLNVTLNNLFIVEANDVVRFNTSTKDQMRVIVDKLVASGVERIVYATDSFIYPYGYYATHTICVPDPASERDAYIRWLKVQAAAYKLMATEFPEIRYFEPINEPDIPGNEVLCKNGMLWGTRDAAFMYSEFDEENICADLCYYIRKAIKSVDEKNMMMTPALTSLNSCYGYLEGIYKAIESGAHPVGDDLPCSVDPDDYFDIIDLHPYSFVAQNIDPDTEQEEGVVLINENYFLGCQKFYDICCDHGDAEKPHWYTELGYTDYGIRARREIEGRETKKQLEGIKEKLPFVECVIFYKMTDHYLYNIDRSENNFGIFTAVANPEEPLQLKPMMEAIYAFMHDGSTDYSAFDEVRAKYCTEE